MADILTQNEIDALLDVVDECDYISTRNECELVQLAIKDAPLSGTIDNITVTLDISIVKSIYSLVEQLKNYQNQQGDTIHEEDIEWGSGGVIVD